MTFNLGRSIIHFELINNLGDQSKVEQMHYVRL